MAGVESALMWGMIRDFVRRWNADNKLAKGQCDSCFKILPDTGAPYAYNTCSPECQMERWASLTA